MNKSAQKIFEKMTIGQVKNISKRCEKGKLTMKGFSNLCHEITKENCLTFKDGFEIVQHIFCESRIRKE